jgi:hypothetical protein
MGLPNQPVTLTVEQIDDLNRKLSTMRHDVNNHLSLLMAAIELVRFKPDMTGKMLDSMTQQPPKVTAIVNQFSEEFEKTFGITRL